jgi:hypothetical protein
VHNYELQIKLYCLKMYDTSVYSSKENDSIILGEEKNGETGECVVATTPTLWRVSAPEQTNKRTLSVGPS